MHYFAIDADLGGTVVVRFKLEDVLYLLKHSDIMYEFCHLINANKLEKIDELMKIIATNNGYIYLCELTGIRDNNLVYNRVHML